MSTVLGGNPYRRSLRHAQNFSQAHSAFGTLRQTQTVMDNCSMSAKNGNPAVGAEIRRRRKALNMTLEELALQAGTDNGNLSKLERGIQGYSDERIRKIASALGCSVADLFSGAEPASNVAMVPIGSRRVPLISYVQAGHMTEAVDAYEVGDASEFLLTDLDISSSSFALEIKGDSMLPEFRPGDRVIIDPTIEPDPGDYVVAKNGNNEATFKRYRPRGINERGDTVFELVPLNEDYPSLRSDMVPIRIIGTMVEKRQYRKRR